MLTTASPADQTTATPHHDQPDRRWGSRLLALIVLLTCARVWLGDADAPQAHLLSTAEASAAQNPPAAPPPFDATAQRKELIDQLNRINERLDAILDVLRKGVVNVAVQSADKPAAAAAPARSKG